MADKKDLLEQLNHFEESLQDTLSQVSSIREALEESQKENAKLRMELEKVREYLAELEKQEKTEEKGKKKAKDEPNPTLSKIYEEGFHVCHLHYAERLEEGESCLDCLELLFR